MGRKYALECGICGYKAVKLCDRDSGFIIQATTIICFDCKTLFDITIYDNTKDKHFPIRCPRGKQHNMREWRFPDICPKCGALINKRSCIMLWD